MQQRNAVKASAPEAFLQTKKSQVLINNTTVS